MTGASMIAKIGEYPNHEVKVQGGRKEGEKLVR
jgi:hypothetical protein